MEIPRNMSTPTQTYIFGVLLLIWISIIGFQTLLGSTAKHVPLVNRSGPKSQPKPLSLLHVQFTSPDESRKVGKNSHISLKPSKNIFAPLTFPKLSSPVIVKKPTPRKPVPVIPIKPSGPSPETLVAERIRKEMTEYRFLGLVYEGAVAQVFLVRNDEIFILREGDVVKGEIRLTKVQPSAIQLQYGDSEIKTTIPISDSQAL